MIHGREKWSSESMTNETDSEPTSWNKTIEPYTVNQLALDWRLHQQVHNFKMKLKILSPKKLSNYSLKLIYTCITSKCMPYLTWTASKLSYSRFNETALTWVSSYLMDSIANTKKAHQGHLRQNKAFLMAQNEMTDWCAPLLLMMVAVPAAAHYFRARSK